MNVKCEICQKTKVKKTLQKIHGVHSINIDANEGKVAVSSTVDLHLFIAMHARVAKGAELFKEPAKPQAMNYLNQVEHQGKKMQFTLGLKQVELNQSENIKMIFRNNDDLDYSSGNDHHYVVKINLDDVQGPQVQAQHEVADECAEPTPPATPSPPLTNHCGGGGSAGSSVHCCHNRPEVKFACSVGSLGIRYMEEPIRPVPQYAPPSSHFVHPFAPPPSYHVHQGTLPPPPPAGSPSPYDVYCGEDNSTCSMM